MSCDHAFHDLFASYVTVLMMNCVTKWWIWYQWSNVVALKVHLSI